MVLEHDSNLDETAEATIRIEVQHMMIDIWNHLQMISKCVKGRRIALADRFGDDMDVLEEMYEKLQEVVDLVNGNPPPDLPEV